MPQHAQIAIDLDKAFKVLITAILIALIFLLSGESESGEKLPNPAPTKIENSYKQHQNADSESKETTSDNKSSPERPLPYPPINKNEVSENSDDGSQKSASDWWIVITAIATAIIAVATI